MKRLGRVLGNLLAVALTVFSMQTLAETEQGGRDFNHMTTGFPLSGGHAAAACETCHMGGVFKGLPRTCDGCHQAGQRIVATPKSNSHIVTDAPCETCHFNTSTWLGARFNHGTAKTGQCNSCHNGRISTGKPARTAIGAHPVTVESCDRCHRSSAWVPASWNHNGVTGDCATCHRAAGPGRSFNALTHMSLGTMSAMNIATCGACHKSFYSFFGAYYDHAGAVICQDCHGPVKTFVGVAKIQQTATAHANFASAGIAQCSSCHKSYTLGSFPAGRFDHAGASLCQNCHKGHSTWAVGITQISAARTLAHDNYMTAGIINCQSCHKSTVAWAGSKYDHVGVSPVCSDCHDRGLFTKKPGGHIATADECSQCHYSTAAWLPALGAKPANHIPYNAGVKCTNCHTGLAKVPATTLHAFSTATYTCANCHITPTSPGDYRGNNQKTRGNHDGSSGNNCTGCHEHSSAGSYGKW